jgi:hypothetical protein
MIVKTAFTSASQAFSMVVGRLDHLLNPTHHPHQITVMFI